MNPSTLPLLFAAVAASAASLTPASAPAAPAAGETPPSRAAAARGLYVIVEPGASGLDAGAIRAAVARDLGIALAPDAASAAATMRIRLVARRTVAVELRQATGRTLSRTIELPETAAGAVESIGLLAGNLGRDEAGELLAELRPPPPPSGGDTPAPPPSGGDPTAGAPAPPPAPAKPAPAKPAPAKPAPAKPAPAKPAPAKPAPVKPAPAKPAPPPAAALTETPVQLSLVHPIALYRDADERRFQAVLGFLHARGGALEGASLVLGLAELGEVRGVAVTVGATSAREAQGVLVAAGWNHVEGGLRGVTIAAGGSDYGSLVGVAIGAGANVGSGPMRGVQIAAGANLAGGSADGVQIAAGANHASGGVHGVQIAAGANVAAGDLTGVQIGLVNVGGHVRGAQIGLVNVSDRIDGLPLGLVNVVSEGRTRLVLGGDGDGFARVAVRYLNGPAYTSLGFGLDLTPSRPARDDVSADAAIGLQAELGPIFAGGEVAYSAVTTSPRPFEREPDRHIARYRARAGWQATDWLAPFVTFGVQQRFLGTENRERLEVAGGIEVF